VQAPVHLPPQEKVEVSGVSDLALEESQVRIEIKEDESAITPRSLLAYLLSSKEFELYYYLFNAVEIGKIEANIIHISREGSDKALNVRLTGVLADWLGGEWSVVIDDIDSPISLKELMHAHFNDSKEWAILRESFPEVEVMDILLG
jgi:hypothetical protein